MEQLAMIPCVMWAAVGVVVGVLLTLLVCVPWIMPAKQENRALGEGRKPVRFNIIDK